TVPESPGRSAVCSATSSSAASRGGRSGRAAAIALAVAPAPIASTAATTGTNQRSPGRLVQSVIAPPPGLILTADPEVKLRAEPPGRRRSRSGVPGWRDAVGGYPWPAGVVAPPCQAGSVRLLVVEDEERLALALQRGLRAEGFAVDLALDGVTGLDLARHGSYDALILDVMLPGLSEIGRASCREGGRVAG